MSNFRNKENKYQTVQMKTISTQRITIKGKIEKQRNARREKRMMYP